jgi:hypothetical protein
VRLSSLDEWQEFWGFEKENSHYCPMDLRQRIMSYQRGEDLVSLDLRPSAESTKRYPGRGFHPGDGGLGEDFDRFRKTPAYQAWFRRVTSGWPIPLEKIRILGVRVSDTGCIHRVMTLLRCFLAAIFLGLANVSPAQNHVASGMGTAFESPDELVLLNIRIASESEEPDGRIRVNLEADVLNCGGGQWSASAALIPSNNPIHNFEPVEEESLIYFDEVLPNSTVISPAQASALVPAAEIDTFRVAALAGDFFQFTGFEFYVFTRPVLAVSLKMEMGLLQFQSKSELSTLKFRLDTVGEGSEGIGQVVADRLEAAVGSVLIENPSERKLLRELGLPPNGGVVTPIGPALPFLIDPVTIDENKNEVIVRGRRLELRDYLVSGTFIADSDDIKPLGRGLYTPEIEATLAGLQKDEISDLDGVYPMPGEVATRERLAIAHGLTVSGGRLFRAGGLKMKFKFRGGSLSETSIEMSASLASTLLLETEGPADNTGASSSSKESQVAFIPLPLLLFNIAGVPVTVTPTLDLFMGAEVNKTTAVSMPMQIDTSNSVEMSWTPDEGPRFNIEKSMTPRTTSPPGIMSPASVSARVFGRAELDLTFQVAGLPIGIGPHIGVEAGANLTLDPTQTPWWEIDADTRLYHGFELSLLGMNIARQDWDFGKESIEVKTADGPAPAQPTGVDAMRSYSAPNTRWMKALHDTYKIGGADDGQIMTSQTSDETLALINFGTKSSLTKLTANGTRLWTGRFHWSQIPDAGVATPDGGVTVVGQNLSRCFIAHYDSNGTLVWSHGWEIDFSLPIEDFLLGSDPITGVDEYFIIGHLNHGHISTSDPVVIKLDSLGEVAVGKLLRRR